MLVVHPKLPVKSVAELVTLARAEPGKIDYASSGNGSSQHLVGALFATMAGAPINHVPYKGSSGAMNDLLGGQVKVSFVGVPNALPNLASGKLRALAVTTAARYPGLPDVPTLAEAGVKGYDATLWLGLLAPPGTRATSSSSSMPRSSLRTRDARRLASAGVDVATSSPEEPGGCQPEYSAGEKWCETGATSIEAVVGAAPHVSGPRVVRSTKRDVLLHRIHVEVRPPKWLCAYNAAPPRSSSRRRRHWRRRRRLAQQVVGRREHHDSPCRVFFRTRRRRTGYRRSRHFSR